MTRLKIQDFGRHKLLDKNLDVSVVGLMGPNGTGKSTILEAIKFAFTATLTDKQETYVRNCYRPEPPEGVKDPEKPANGKVTVWFRKDGKDGELFRQVGKTPKRHLKWEGETITAAADIEATLKELFEADKEARANAIFPPQGSLDKLLFGTPTERSDLYTKLLLVGYTGKIVDIIDQQSAILLDQVQDYTTILTEVRTQHTTAEEEYAELEGRRARSYDWNADYQQFRDYLNKVIEVRDAGLEKKDLETAIDKHRHDIEQSVATMGEVLGLAPCDTSLEEVMREIKGLDTALVEMRAGYVNLQRLVALKSEYETSKVRLNEVREELEDIPEDWKSHQKTIKELEDQLEVDKQRDALVDRQVLAATKVDNLLKVIGVGLTRTPFETEVVAAEEEWTAAEHDVILTRGKVQALQSLLEAGDTDDACCPVCGEEASGKSHDWDDRLTKANEELAALEAILREKYLTADGMRKRRDKEDEQDAAVEAGRDLIEELNKQIRPLAMVQHPQKLIKEIKDMKEHDERARLALVKRAGLDREQELLEGIINKVTPKDMLAIMDISEASIYVEEAVLVQAEKNRVACDDKEVKKLTAAQASLIDMNDNLIGVNDTLIKINNARITMYNGLSGKTQSLLKANQNNNEDTLAALQERAQEYSELAGQVTQAKEQADTLQDRVSDIETQIEKDQLRQNVVSELAQLRKAFVRKGIPQSYMQYIFESLVPMAQDNLNTLGADFVIKSDPVDPVTIQFMKLTDDGSGWMPQNKMSGGQKVRVSIAFLLAVQQLVIPDIAFMVLDEPSTHIDDDGIDSLEELFSALGEQLQHTEAQVWVCDHKPELQSSFQEIIKLA